MPEKKTAILNEECVWCLPNRSHTRRTTRSHQSLPWRQVPWQVVGHLSHASVRPIEPHHVTALLSLVLDDGYRPGDRPYPAGAAWAGSSADWLREHFRPARLSRTSAGSQASKLARTVAHTIIDIESRIVESALNGSRQDYFFARSTMYCTVLYCTVLYWVRSLGSRSRTAADRPWWADPRRI